MFGRLHKKLFVTQNGTSSGSDVASSASSSTSNNNNNNISSTLEGNNNGRDMGFSDEEEYNKDVANNGNNNNNNKSNVAAAKRSSARISSSSSSDANVADLEGIDGGGLEGEYYFKFIIVGGPCTGKSSIARRFAKGIFTSQYIPTIGIDVYSSAAPVSSAKLAKYKFKLPVRVQLWDVPHAEIKGKNLTRILEDIHGAIITFDITNVKSIQAVDQWRNAIGDHTNNVLLVATKSDKSKHIVSASDLDAYIRDSGYVGWNMTTARSDRSVRAAIDVLVDLVLLQMLRKHKGGPPPYRKKSHTASTAAGSQHHGSSRSSSGRGGAGASSATGRGIVVGSSRHPLRAAQHSGDEESTDQVLFDELNATIRASNTNFNAEDVAVFKNDVNNFYQQISMRLKEYLAQVNEQTGDVNRSSIVRIICDECKSESGIVLGKLDTILEELRALGSELNSNSNSNNNNNNNNNSTINTEQQQRQQHQREALQRPQRYYNLQQQQQSTTAKVPSRELQLHSEFLEMKKRFYTGLYTKWLRLLQDLRVEMSLFCNLGVTLCSNGYIRTTIAGRSSSNSNNKDNDSGAPGMAVETDDTDGDVYQAGVLQPTTPSSNSGVGVGIDNPLDASTAVMLMGVKYFSEPMDTRENLFPTLTQLYATESAPFPRLASKQRTTGRTPRSPIISSLPMRAAAASATPHAQATTSTMGFNFRQTGAKISDLVDVVSSQTHATTAFE